MSDIEYLSIKEFDVKRVDKNTTLDLSNSIVETDVVTQTAAGGKDMYLGEATCPMHGTDTEGGPPGFTATYRLFANGIEIETIQLFINIGTGQENQINFKTLGIKVAAGQIIKITVQHSLAGGRSTHSEGKLVLWQEDTGTTPQIPST